MKQAKEPISFITLLVPFAERFIQMTRRKRSPEENERSAKIRELLLSSNISSMDDIQDLFKETIAEFMESGLEAELDDELGYAG